MNIMLRSGANIGEDKRNKLKEDAWVRKAPTKQPEFDLERVKEEFMEAKKTFTEASTLGSTDQTESERDTSMLTTILETCMKILWDTKAVKGLQESITRCAGSDEPQMVWKLGEHALQAGWEMQLTTQIGDYEMDQVVLDLGLDANVLPKQTWEHMGRPALQWSPI